MLRGKDAVGGYFELEVGGAKSNLSQWGYGFQSARAALFSFLSVAAPQKVWLPKYLCNSVREPIDALGIEVDYYDIDSNFRLFSPPRLKASDLLVYVNYFGLCGGQQAELMAVYPPEQLIFDHSQAFFARPRNVLATIYSPRKFFGVPDGGFLVTDCEIEIPKEEYSLSMKNADFLLARLVLGPESGYPLFKEAEQRLNDFEPRRISELTATMLSRLDFEVATRRRRSNFEYLHSRLGNINRLQFRELGDSVPLCYPLMTGDKGLREFLIQQRIFVPTYWPDISHLVSKDSFESALIDLLLPLPCDQRYGPAEMERLVELIGEMARK